MSSEISAYSTSINSRSPLDPGKITKLQGFLSLPNLQIGTIGVMTVSRVSFPWEHSLRKSVGDNFSFERKRPGQPAIGPG